MTTHPLTHCQTDDIIARQQERGFMNEQEVISLLRAHRWTLINRMRNEKRYLYAQQRQGVHVIERYIAPFSRLERLTPEQIINKLEGAGRPKSMAAIGCINLGRITQPIA